MESFCNHLKGYEQEKVENVMRALMKYLAATLSRPPDEEEFAITLDEQGWNLGSVQGHLQQTDEVQVQLLVTLKGKGLR